MEIAREYTNKLNHDELAHFTSKISNEGIITNETYYYTDKATGLRVKSYLRYENWSSLPATGIYVKIINPSMGVVDSQLFDFSLFFSGMDNKSKNYWIRKADGWADMEPTNAQREALAEEISKFVSVYM